MARRVPSRERFQKLEGLDVRGEEQDPFAVKLGLEHAGRGCVSNAMLIMSIRMGTKKMKMGLVALATSTFSNSVSRLDHALIVIKIDREGTI